MTAAIIPVPWDDPYKLFTLRNRLGMQVCISDLGATLVSWQAPDRYGRLADVLLGYEHAADYLCGKTYFGGLIGRWGNRIRNGRFELDGKTIQLDCNEGPTHLHGGYAGFHLAHWASNVEGNRLLLKHASPAGEGGFPGTLLTEVCYQLDDHGALMIHYHAVCDAPTPINLTSHPYFNLDGSGATIKDHLLWIDADHYLEIDKEAIPVRWAETSGTAFDFREAAPIGPRLGWPESQLAIASGFDHCFCLNGEIGKLREVARLYAPASGRELSVATTERGLQFYSGNYLEGVMGHVRYKAHDGLCLEAQTYPDQVNSPDAELAILRPGEAYSQTTRYTLTLRD